MTGDTVVETKKSGTKRRVVIISLGLVTLMVFSSIVWFTGVLGHLSGRQSHNVAANTAERPQFFDLPDIISNLDTGGHRAGFIKLHAKIEVMHTADVIVLQNSIPQILDIFQTYLRSTRPEELRGGEGTYRLREALMNRIDVVIAPTQVTDLLFIELLVQ